MTSDDQFLSAAKGETKLAKVMQKLGWNNATVLSFARRLRPDLIPTRPKPTGYTPTRPAPLPAKKGGGK